MGSLWREITYLTQWLEYCFHTARVIGSNPIVGKTGRNPCFCQHGLAARSQLNHKSIGSFHLWPSSTVTLKVIELPPLFFSSCMWAACPVPNRRTGTSWRKARERELSINSPLPSSTIRWSPGGPERPTGNLSPRHTILSRSALSDVSTPAPASKEVSRYQATKWKWTAPRKSSRVF